MDSFQPLMNLLKEKPSLGKHHTMEKSSKSFNCWTVSIDGLMKSHPPINLKDLVTSLSDCGIQNSKMSVTEIIKSSN